LFQREIDKPVVFERKKRVGNLSAVYFLLSCCGIFPFVTKKGNYLLLKERNQNISKQGFKIRLFKFLIKFFIFSLFFYIMNCSK